MRYSLCSLLQPAPKFKRQPSQSFQSSQPSQLSRRPVDTPNHAPNPTMQRTTEMKAKPGQSAQENDEYSEFDLDDSAFESALSAIELPTTVTSNHPSNQQGTQRNREVIPPYSNKAIDLLRGRCQQIHSTTITGQLRRRCNTEKSQPVRSCLSAHDCIRAIGIQSICLRKRCAAEQRGAESSCFLLRFLLC